MDGILCVGGIRRCCMLPPKILLQPSSMIRFLLFSLFKRYILGIMMKFRQASITMIPTVSSTLESGFCDWARRQHAIKPVANSIDHAIAVICMFTLFILRRLILDSSDNTVSRKLLFWDLWKICPIEYQEYISTRDYYILLIILYIVPKDHSNCCAVFDLLFTLHTCDY